MRTLNNINLAQLDSYLLNSFHSLFWDIVYRPLLKVWMAIDTTAKEMLRKQGQVLIAHLHCRACANTSRRQRRVGKLLHLPPA
jgi:hypothetical protein